MMVLMIADTYSPSEYLIQTDLAGESKDFFVIPSMTTPMQLNFYIEHTYSLKLWGQLFTVSKLPLYKAQVKLLEITAIDIPYSYKKVAETTTDESGFYYLTYDTHTLNCYYLFIEATNPLNNRFISLAFNPCMINSNCTYNCTSVLCSHLYDHTF